MCTALATIARGELLTEDDRGVLDRLSYSYVGEYWRASLSECKCLIRFPDLLSRLRLHTSAAYVRKHGASQELKASTNVSHSFIATDLKSSHYLSTRSIRSCIQPVGGVGNQS